MNFPLEYNFTHIGYNTHTVAYLKAYVKVLVGRSSSNYAGTCAIIWNVVNGDINYLWGGVNLKFINACIVAPDPPRGDDLYK